MSMSLKRKGESAPFNSSLKKFGIDNDGDQVISDDGEDVLHLGQTGFSDSGETDDDEDPDEGESNQSDSEMKDIGGGTKAIQQAKPSTDRSIAFKAATTEEVRMIKDASDLFKSNAFKIQVESLLPTVQPKRSRLGTLEKVLFQLHSLISNSPPVRAQHPLKASQLLLKQGINVPYPSPLPTPDTNWKVAFESPTSIQLVGSWPNNVSVLGKDETGFEVDMGVEMPSALFQEKDFINGRFFYKKAFYLSTLASVLKKAQELPVDISYHSPQEDLRLTCLYITPRKTKSSLDFTSSNTSIRIIPILSFPAPFPITRLSPSHGNIRKAQDDLPQAHDPSPLYNNFILQSHIPAPHLLSSYQFKTDIPAYADALTLLKVWANQRGYGKHGKRVVRGFESACIGSWWGFLLGYLVYGDENLESGKKRKSVGRGLSSYQLFRAALDFLAKHDFATEPVFMKTTDGPKIPQAEFVKHHNAVFIDPTSTFNFLSETPLSSLTLLRNDAYLTLKLLDRDPESFDWTFMRDLRDPHIRFDSVLRISLDDAASRNQVVTSTLEHGSQTNALLSRVLIVLQRALNTRAKHCVILNSSSSLRPITQAEPGRLDTIEVGLILDQAQAWRLVDHGPSVDDLEAGQEFKEFWGNKSELRRFKDGAIVESVVWDVNTAEGRAHIPLRIVEYILGHHFSIPADHIHGFSPQYDSLLIRPPGLVRLYSTEVGGYRSAITAFDSLVKTIKTSGFIPLSLVNLSPTCDYLRYTSVFQPGPLSISRYKSLPTCSQYLPAMDVVFQFEKSAKWPDDLAAIQKVKLAFFEALAQGLLKSGVAKHAAVVLDAEAHVIEDNCHLEIITSTGFSFRGRIYHDREETLLKRLTTQSKAKEPEFRHKQVERALQLHHLRFIHSPRHHSAITTLHHRCPSYSPSVRLLKRWLAAHMLSPHIPNEVAELLCASAYLNPGSLETPGSGPTGFSRTIMLLKDWDFRFGPLYVPLYTATGLDEDSFRLVKFPQEKRVEADTQWKKRVGEVAWNIVTEEDLTGVVFGTVKAVIAMRVQQIAKATWSYMCSGMLNGTYNPKSIFFHPLDDYDFIIHLNPKVLPKYSLNVDAKEDIWAQSTKYKNITEESVYGTEIRVDFDPASLFVVDLQRTYANSALFFFDSLGGCVIAGLWDPQVREPRPFRVFSSYSSMPTAGTKDSKKPLVSLNEAAIIAEIERMGQGLILKIEIRSS